MFNSIMEVAEYINKDVNIISCGVTLDDNRYKINLYTNWFGCSETVPDDDKLEERVRGLLNRVGMIVKLNNYIATKNSLLNITFVYSDVDFVTMENYNTVFIHISPENINMLPLDDLEAELLADKLMDSLNIVELLHCIDKHKVLGKHRDVYEVLNTGMNNLNDVIASVKGKTKGKLSTVILLIIRDLAIIALLRVNILIDIREIDVNIFDNKVLSLDTGAVLNNNDIGIVIADRVKTHISNSI